MNPSKLGNSDAHTHTRTQYSMALPLLQFAPEDDEVFVAGDESALASTGGGDAQRNLLVLPQQQWRDDDDDDDTTVQPLPEDMASAAEYQARTPEPAYSQFIPEYSDQYGREYALARAGGFLAQNRDDVNNGVFDTPPRTGSVSANRLLLFFRMPINQRYSVPLPEPDGEELQLYFVATQVICVAKTDGVFVSGPRARTGHLFVRDFESRGQVADPTPYEPFLGAGGKEPGKTWF